MDKAPKPTIFGRATWSAKDRVALRRLSREFGLVAMPCLAMAALLFAFNILSFGWQLQLQVALPKWHEVDAVVIQRLTDYVIDRVKLPDIYLPVYQVLTVEGDAGKLICSKTLDLTAGSTLKVRTDAWRLSFSTSECELQQRFFTLALIYFYVFIGLSAYGLYALSRSWLDNWRADNATTTRKVVER